MIKFVYFDVGGVVIHDFSGTDNWDRLKNELGVTPERNQEFEEFYQIYEPQVCLGMDVESLLPLIIEKFGSNLPNKYSLLMDGFVNKFRVNKSIWPVIEKFHHQCKVGLLTNQYPNMLEAIKKRGLLPPIDWDVVIDSSVDSVKKPDKDIFELGQKQAGYSGKDILFIENSLIHLNSAKNLGWQTYLYNPVNTKKSNEELIKLFELNI